MGRPNHVKREEKVKIKTIIDSLHAFPHEAEVIEISLKSEMTLSVTLEIGEELPKEKPVVSTSETDIPF